MSTIANLVAGNNLALADKIAAARSLVAEQIAAARAGDICVTSSFQAEDMVVVHSCARPSPMCPSSFSIPDTTFLRHMNIAIAWRRNGI